MPDEFLSKETENFSAMAVTTPPPERQALVKACVARDWSKAIRILNSILDQSCTVQDICNRAFCYSRLELHKHVIKDCDKALELDHSNLQACVLKGHALTALGKQEDALQAWKQGYEDALGQPVDLKQLLELQELLANSESDSSVVFDSQNAEPPDSSISVANSTCKSPVKPAEKAKPLQKEVSISSQVVQKPRSISLDLRLSRGIAQVNEGNYDQAIAIFNQILRDNPASPEALIGRGTAYAFQRKLETAISDFSKAIQSNPTTGEAWKRRGQARAALGDSVEAVKDLRRALEFDPKSSDILHERGMVFFKSKDYEDAVEDLSACVQLDKDNKSAYSYMGLALVSVGDYKRAFEAHEKAVELDPEFKEGWCHMAQSYQELGEYAKGVECLEKVLSMDSRFVNAYRLLGMLRHGLGNHKNAIKELSAGLEWDKSNVECLYLRASCWHAIGDYANAKKDYDAVLNLDVDSQEKFVLQCLAFYQRELALYTASKANVFFSLFDIDGDLHPMFKEAWCKRLHPKGVCEVVVRQPPLRDSLKKGRLKQQDFVMTKSKKILLEAADRIGKKIQYSCPGFLQNKRQHRMAGLAAIEIAQKVSNTWHALRESCISGGTNETKGGKRPKKKERSNMVSQNRGGACCSSSSSDTTSCSYHEEKPSSGRLTLGWQDVYSIAVKWRQASEPCDSVVWVNRLSEDFNAGFGSHTPMILGQAKIVRYYPNFKRAFSIAKALMLERKNVNNAANELVDLSDPEKLEAIKIAQTCSDLYSTVNEDFWLVIPCNSIAYEGLFVRYTVVKYMGQPT
uniref:Suppressor of RPS4-RLD 1 n=1 Tax=Araucaria cunninghamii TaxID=56994 RepID=A0A0D6R5N2_ARACU